MKINTNNMKWLRAPKQFTVTEDKIEIITEPHTDLWQRTYYHFRNDNAPVLQAETNQKYFSFVIKTSLTLKYDMTRAVLLCILTVKTGLRRL